MAPAPAFLPEAVSNVFRIPFFRRRSSSRSSSKSRSGSAAPSRVPSPEPPAGPQSQVLQKSTRMANTEKQLGSSVVEELKESSVGASDKGALSTDITNENRAPDKVESVQNNAFVKLEAIVEQSHSDLDSHIRRVQRVEDAESGEASDMGTPEQQQNSLFKGFSVPVAMERQVHISSDAPIARHTSPVSYVTTPPDSDVSIDAETASMEYIEAPTHMSFENEAEVRPCTPATIPAITQSSFGTEVDVAVEEASSLAERDSLSIPHDLSFASFGSSYSHSLNNVSLSDTVSSDIPLSPMPVEQPISHPRIPPIPRPTTLDVPHDKAQAAVVPVKRSPAPVVPDSYSKPIANISAEKNHVTVRLGGHTVEMGIPVVSTYADATNLALQFPEISEQILKQPLAGSRDACSQRDVQTVGTTIETAFSAPHAGVHFADERVFHLEDSMHAPSHSDDRPNWAKASNDSNRQSRPRGRGRGRGRGGRDGRSGRDEHYDRQERGRSPADRVESTQLPGRVAIDNLFAPLKAQMAVESLIESMKSQGLTSTQKQASAKDMSSAPQRIPPAKPPSRPSSVGFSVTAPEFVPAFARAAPAAPHTTVKSSQAPPQPKTGVAVGLAPEFVPALGLSAQAMHHLSALGYQLEQRSTTAGTPLAYAPEFVPSVPAKKHEVGISTQVPSHLASGLPMNARIAGLHPEPDAHHKKLSFGPSLTVYPGAPSVEAGPSRLASHIPTRQAPWETGSREAAARPRPIEAVGLGRPTSLERGLPPASKDGRNQPIASHEVKGAGMRDAAFAPSVPPQAAGRLASFSIDDLVNVDDQRNKLSATLTAAVREVFPGVVRDTSSFRHPQARMQVPPPIPTQTRPQSIYGSSTTPLRPAFGPSSPVIGVSAPNNSPVDLKSGSAWTVDDNVRPRQQGDMLRSRPQSAFFSAGSDFHSANANGPAVARSVSLHHTQRDIHRASSVSPLFGDGREGSRMAQNAPYFALGATGFAHHTTGDDKFTADDCGSGTDPQDTLKPENVDFGKLAGKIGRTPTNLHGKRSLDAFGRSRTHNLFKDGVHKSTSNEGKWRARNVDGGWPAF